MDEPHAVRWITRTVDGGAIEFYSKWHWSKDGVKTLCNRYIAVCTEYSFLPECEDDPEIVECNCCRKRLGL